MRGKTSALLILLCLLAVPSFAQQSAASAKAGKGDWALLFNFTNLAAAVSPYNDGYQAGAGAKYWFSDTIGARALAYALVEPDSTTDTSTTHLGLSAACEIHPLPGRVSPYFGGTAGCTFLFEPAQNYMDFFLGGIGGVEVRIFQNFSLYAEYQALLVRDYDGLWFKLGNEAILGFLIYF
jgi:hypothetical protein